MPSVAWYVSRLRSMSLLEMSWRVHGMMKSRLDALLPIRNPTRAEGAISRMNSWPAPELLGAPLQEAADRVLRNEVDLFGRTFIRGDADWNQDPASGIQVPLVRGTTLDCRDPTLVGDARTIWEVNRHFQLVSLAQGWALSGDESYRSKAADLLSSWLQACPYPLGINWASPLEHGVRLINWYLAGRLMGGQFLGPEASRQWQESIYWHCHFISSHQSRYSSANNHLVGELAGLYVGSNAWPLWKESEGWRRSAKENLVREVERQVHADGVSREQTVGYQIFVLQLLIVAGLAGEESGDSFPARYWLAVRRMIGFLRAIADHSGNLPNFGDSDDGMAFRLSPSALSRRLSDLLDIDDWFSHSPRVDWDPQSAAAWLQTGFPRPPNWYAEIEEVPVSFPEGGYYILGQDGETAQSGRVVFDAAPLGYLSIAAHGHADCLSFVLSIAGHEILVDPGTFCYFGDPQFRRYFRSTAAHNTLGVDGEDQSVMAGPFMWLSKAQPEVVEFHPRATVATIRARHDGYCRLADPVMHERELAFDREAGAMTVVDRVTCRARHEIERNWHFSEHCEVAIVAAGRAMIRCGNVHLEFQTESDSRMILRRGSVTPPGGWISRRFGSRVESTTLIVQDRIDADRVLTTQFNWQVAP